MSKDGNLTELTKQHNTQLEYYKKMNKELDEKTKSQSARIIELESQLEMAKNQLEKAKRNLAAG
jgi:chromosome segregation ATPase